MKPTANFLLFVLSITTAFSQNREVVLTRGFENTAAAADTLPGNRWVFVTQSSPAAGSIYLDTITLWVTDSTGRITQSATVTPALPFERYDIYDLVTLLDTSVLLIYTGADCDACCYDDFIEKWNLDGTLAWRLDLPKHYEQPYAVSSVSPDLLYILSGITVFEVDARSGQILSTGEYTSYGDYPRQASFIYGTRDVIAYNAIDSIAHFKFDSAGSAGYSRKETKHMLVILYDFKSSRDGNIYASIRPNNKILRINADLEFMSVADYPLNGLDFTPTSDGVITLTRDGEQFRLTLFNTNGQLQSTYILEHPQLDAYKVYTGYDEIGVTGAYTAGGNGGSSGSSKEAWFRIYPLDSLNDHPSVFSVAITDVEQGEPVIHDSVYINEFNFVGYLDNIRGGDFRMQVKNTGDQPVESFRINYHFGNDWFYWYCGLDQVKNVQYNIHLEPGESTWVDFGDIESNHMFSVPDLFCFWTSAPSDRPDDAFADDRFCTDWIVPVFNPTYNPIQIIPNPATDEIIINGIPNLEDISASIYSVDGKLWLQGFVHPNNSSLTVNTQLLPDGFYLVRVQEFTTPLVINRR